MVGNSQSDGIITLMGYIINPDTSTLFIVKFLQPKVHYEIASLGPDWSWCSKSCTFTLAMSFCSFYTLFALRLLSYMQDLFCNQVQVVNTCQNDTIPKTTSLPFQKINDKRHKNKGWTMNEDKVHEYIWAKSLQDKPEFWEKVNTLMLKIWKENILFSRWQLVREELSLVAACAFTVRFCKPKLSLFPQTTEKYVLKIINR